MAPHGESYDLAGISVSRQEMRYFLIGLLLVSFILTFFLDQGYRLWDHLSNYVDPSFYHKPFWKYLLPMEDPPLQGLWPTGTVILGALLQQYIHPGIVLFCGNAVLIVSGFYISLSLFRSLAFSSTFALALLFLPFNYHVFLVSGTTLHTLLIVYLLCFVYSAKFFVANANIKHFTLVLISLILFMLAYETWLDAAAIFFLISPPVLYILNRYNKKYCINYAYICCIVFLLAITYVAIKLSSAAFGGHGQGSETDLLIFHKSFRMIADDFIGKIITFFFTGLSVVLPPEITTSLSLGHFTPEEIVAAQGTYHRQMQFLTYMNHLFIWRFYAGFAFAVFLYLQWKSWRALDAGPDRWQAWVAFVAIAMLLFGAGTHSVVKYRPMQSMPYLAYQTWVNYLGAVALLCLVADWLSRRFSKNKSLACLVALWTMIVYTGFAVRTSFGIKAVNMGMGLSPDPLEILRKGVLFLQSFL